MELLKVSSGGTSELSQGNKKRSKLLLAMFLMLGFSFATMAQSPEIRNAFRLIDIEQPSKGLKALEQLEPNANNLYYLGLAQLQTGAQEKALASFEKGISADGKNGLNYAGKAQIKLMDKNPAEAKELIDQALKVSRSKDPEVLKAIARAYLVDTKYLLDAINTINKGIERNNADPELQMLLGDALLLQNKQNAGPTVSAYEKAARLDPKFAKPYFKIGKIYQAARSLDIAISNFEKAISIDAEFAPAYKELGEIAYTQREAKRAVEMYEKYLAITENPGNAKFQYAFFLFMAKQYDKANAIFKEVISNPNVSCVALRYYAYSLTVQSEESKDATKTQEAQDIFKRYFDCAKPEEIQASDYGYFGKLLLETKQDSLANEYFAQSLELDSAQTDIAQLHAETYLKRNKYENAIDAFKHLMSLRAQPLSQDLWQIGQAYYYSEQFAEADTAFTALAERQPNMTIGFQYAARARRQIDSTGVMALANPMYEKLIEKALTNPEKYKRELIEAYEYFGSYYVQVKPDVEKAKEYFAKILAIDPKHAQAQEFMKAVKGG